MYKVKVFFQSLAGGVEFKKIYHGSLEKGSNVIKINYSEIDENGETKTEITVVGNDFVTVSRKGQFSNFLEIKKDYGYRGEYLTPYGKIPVEIFTRELSVEYNGVYPKIKAKYKSSLMGEVTENQFSLAVKPL